ncbi:hypothetical protein ABK040_014974 [Willaertia magna]
MLKGRVHRHVSPNQQHVFSHFFHGIHKRLFVRFKRIAIDAGPAFALYAGIYFWSNSVKHHNELKERP